MLYLCWCIYSYLQNIIVSNVDPMLYIDYSQNTSQDVHTTVDDKKINVLQLNNSAAGRGELPPSIMKQFCNKYCIPLSYNYY